MNRSRIARTLGLLVAGCWLYGLSACALAQAASAGATPADEGPRDTVVREIGGDRFAAGATLRFTRPSAGDLFAAAGTIDAAAQVAGDAFLAGGSVRLAGPIGQNGYLVGGQLAVAGRVARNLRAAGGSVDLAREASVGINASLAGNRVEVLGSVGGTLQVAGARVFIDAPVGGDVDVAADDLELGPNARIAGRLRYASASELKRDAAARVDGGIERRASPAGEHPRARERGGFFAAFGFASLLWTIGIALVAVLLLIGLPGLTARTVERARSSVVVSVALGFAALASLPLLALVAAVTVIGLPFALLVVLAYPPLLMLGYACGLLALSDALLARLSTQRAGRFGWRVATLIVVALLATAIGWVPVAGWLFALLLLAAGLGALLRVLWGLRAER